MDTRKLWPEFIIAGSLYLATLVFLAIRLLGKDASDFGFETFWNANAAQVAAMSAVAIAASYLLGLLVNRLLSSIFIWLRRLLVRVNHGKEPFKGTTDPQDEDLARILSKDPPSLGETLQARYMAKAFFRSLSVGLPLLGWASWPWGFGSSDSRIFLTSIVIFTVLEAGFIVAFLTQRGSHNSFLAAANNAAKRKRPT